MSAKFSLACPRARIEGRAIAIDTSSAGPRMAGTHMTLFFRGDGFNRDEVATVNKAIEAAIVKNQKINYTFTLIPWGKRSMLVKGDLETLGMDIRSEFPQWCMKSDRPLHIKMVKN